MTAYTKTKIVKRTTKANGQNNDQPELGFMKLLKASAKSKENRDYLMGVMTCRNMVSPQSIMRYTPPNSMIEHLADHFRISSDIWTRPLKLESTFSV